MKNISLTLFFVSILVSVAARNNLTITHHGRTDHKGGNQNWSVDSDSKGFIYVANNNGLLMYDGSRWEKYSIEEQTVLRSVCAESDNKIYVGTYEDFGYWEKYGNSYKYVSLKPSADEINFHNNEIWKIVIHNGKVYFQGFSALFVYEKNKVRSIKLPGLILFMLKADNRLFFQEVNGGVYELVNDVPVLLQGTTVLANTEVKTINKLNNGNLLIGTTDKGLFQYNGITVTSWNCPANEHLKRNQINNSIVLGSNIVFGTIVNGVYIVDHNGNILNNINSETGLQNNTVLALAAVDNRTLWIGLDRGIDQIDFNSPLALYRQPDQRLGAVYTAALKANKLYVGTNRGIFTYHYNPEGEALVYEGFVDKSQGQVWMLKDIDGTLFCGHNSGTFILENGLLKKISNVTGGYNLSKFYKNGKEYLIQGTYTSLVIYEKINGQWSFRNQITGFYEPSKYLETDFQGNIWIGHAIKGLYRLRLSDNLDSVVEQTFFGKTTGLVNDHKIKVMKIDNRVVFACNASLLTWNDLNRKIIPYTDYNKSFDQFTTLTFMSPAQSGLYWICTPDECGLYRFSGNVPELYYRIHLTGQGLNPVEDNDNVVVLNDHLSLICLDNGFGIVNHNLIPGRPNKQLELVWRFVNAFSGTEKKVIENQNTGISHAFNNIIFAFAILHDNSINKLFQYRLLPLENNWSDWSNTSLASYSRLDDGKYTFQVRAMDESGFISEPVEFKFRIKPPYYASGFAFFLYAFFALAIVYSAMKIYRKLLTAKHLRTQAEIEKNALFEIKKSEGEILQLQNEKLHNEVLHKNMQLANSTMSMIRKNEVLIEIKNELEAQKEVLGNRFPVRYFDRLNNIINRNISNDIDWQIFESHFDQAHEDFFRRLMKMYPDLTQSDLKLCAYLRLNLSSKEIAQLLNISIRGVEIRRYRLRKRLSLDTDTNLVEFILHF